MPFNWYGYTSNIQGRQLRPKGQARQTAYGSVHLFTCSSDLTLCLDVKLMISNDLGSLSSALEKYGDRRVVIFVECQCVLFVGTIGPLVTYFYLGPR
jgi:hypothetical protein